MHREDTATLTTYLSDNLKIFTCLTPLQSSGSLSTKTEYFSSDQQNRVNHLNNKPNTAQSRYNSLCSSAAKPYFATITLSPEEIDSFRAFFPVIENFYHFQLYVKNKQRAREHRNQFNYGYEQNKLEATAATKRAANPTMELMSKKKFLPLG